MLDRITCCVIGTSKSVCDCVNRLVSDIDLLVEMDPDRSLWDIAGLVQDLEEQLDRRSMC